VATALGAIQAQDALEQVEGQLLDLLPTLSAEDWEEPTIVSGWRVQQVVAHLLDTALRKVSIVRDGYAAERPSSGSAEDLRAFVDGLNAQGVAVYGRLSPPVLVALTRTASRDLCALHRGLDPYAPATFPVSWAGEEQSLNWFDAARELTERWHHQQQVRLAVDRPGIMTRALYHPVLDCFMRALPYTYRNVAAPVGTHVEVRVSGESGGVWNLRRDHERWLLLRGVPEPPTASVTIPEDIAWRVFTKGIRRDEAEAQVAFDGDRALGVHVLGSVAIVG
jgi:uncharacterized protein (TIGR03083 family)